MKISARHFLLHILVVASASSLLSIESSAQQGPNTNAIYHQLRTLLPGPVTIPVSNFTLKRDAATFTFTRGEFALFGEVNGKVTGAVFGGTGHLHLTPPTAIERQSLEILTKKPEFDQDFTQVILRFTDSTADELRKAGDGKTSTQPDSSLVSAAQEFHTFQREKLKENIDLRLLQDVVSPAPGGFFLAEVRGVTDGHILLEIDPNGAPGVAPEEVRLGIWNSWGWSFPAAFHLASEYAAGTASSRQENEAFHVDTEELDTTIEKGGFLGGHAKVHLQALQDGVAVLPFDLYRTLRVSQVDGEHGEALDFVQERKEDDPDFGLTLATPLKKGESTTVTITYGGKDAVLNSGQDNYDPIARVNWFPNAGGFGSYVRYKMTFHTPKEIEFIATGNKLSDKADGKSRTSEWDSMTPIPVAGFHLGRFKEQDAKTSDGLAVAAYANKDLPDWAAGILRKANGDVPTNTNTGASTQMTGVALGNLNTTSMLPVELSEGTVAAQVYSAYFGKLSFDHLALSQQPACSFGQSWPMLVYLPICGFWDSTVQNQLGLDPADPYWKTVTAHEVAHQWWGHTVSFKSYRDQWMSEGFAEASAGIFLKTTRKSPNDSKEFWKQLKDEITNRDKEGFRPIDVGPVTMGLRLSTNKTGWNIYRNLVYPKGGYILHMLQMMMWSEKTGDDAFRLMMRDFVDTYRLKVATTEDFKAIVEKHMLPGMDLEQNHKMNWFFNEYVYGTDLPQYHFESDITAKGDAATLHFKLTQSGVPENFKMVVPIYLELSNGTMIRLGLAAVAGNSSAEQTVPFNKVPVPIKRALLDPMYEVLAIEN